LATANKPPRRATMNPDFLIELVVLIVRVLAAGQLLG
jgi:hypothetical protein